MLSQARQEFKKREYDHVVDLVKEIVKENPNEQEALFLLNKSLLASGNEHLKKREYDKSQSDLEQIAEGFPGRTEALAELGRQKRKLAEEHYRQGVKFYLDEDLTAAIREWRLALKFYPEHTRAQENIAKTRAILDKLETVK
jgi:tetratricopeptide (TPR) repeat protein